MGNHLLTYERGKFALEKANRKARFRLLKKGGKFYISRTSENYGK